MALRGLLWTIFASIGILASGRQPICYLLVSLQGPRDEIILKRGQGHSKLVHARCARQGSHGHLNAATPACERIRPSTQNGRA
jgi:hypothetical protein